MMDRIIFLGTGIDDQIANIVQAQLLFLEKLMLQRYSDLFEFSWRKCLCRIRDL
jgi:hypothetical protein